MRHQKRHFQNFESILDWEDDIQSKTNNIFQKDVIEINFRNKISREAF